MNIRKCRLFWGTVFFKPSAANELVHPKLTRTRTEPEPSPAYTEMLEPEWISRVPLVVAPELARRVLTGFRFRTPQNPKI